jgi:hypothetical protein
MENMEMLEKAKEAFAENPETQGLLNWMIDEIKIGHLEKAYQIKKAVENMAERNIISSGILERI